MKRQMMIVDDEPAVRRALAAFVRHDGHDPLMAENGHEALKRLNGKVDLVLLDANMPGMKGFEVAKRIRQKPEYKRLPIIMLTGMSDRKSRLQAAQAGVNDFLSKPVDMLELQLKTELLLDWKSARDELKQHQIELEHQVEQRTVELQRALTDVEEVRDQLKDAQLEILKTLAAAAEYKDECTARHVDRVGHFCGAIASAIGLPKKRVTAIETAAFLHDVGKIGIPDSILLKQGPLTQEEREVMKRHTLMGARILSNSHSSIMRLASTIAETHHEWWDGGGYPHGRVGMDIPLEGRICAVADVFDALTCRRPYKPAFSNEKAFGILIEGRGSQFDPEILDTFLGMKDKIRAVQADFCHRKTGEIPLLPENFIDKSVAIDPTEGAAEKEHNKGFQGDEGKGKGGRYTSETPYVRKLRSMQTTAPNDAEALLSSNS